jgi:hypothetical protein
MTEVYRIYNAQRQSRDDQGPGDAGAQNTGVDLSRYADARAKRGPQQDATNADRPIRA